MDDRSPRPDFAHVEFVLCDLDGVVWLTSASDPRCAGGDRAVAIERSACAVRDQQLDVGDRRTGGVRSPRSEFRRSVTWSPVPRPAHRSSVSGETALVCGGPGVVEAVEARGAIVVGADVEARRRDRRSAPGLRLLAPPGCERARFVQVLASWRPTTTRRIRHPTVRSPGAGALVAAVATASGATPTIAGKPYEPMAELVAARCGPRFSGPRALMVGDRLEHRRPVRRRRSGVRSRWCEPASPRPDRRPGRATVLDRARPRCGRRHRPRRLPVSRASRRIA